MKTSVILVTCSLLLAALAHLSTGMPYEGESCLRIVTRLILEDCSKGKRSVMLQEVGFVLSQHRAAKYSRHEDLNTKENLGELLGVPSDWADDELEELRRHYRQNIQHLWVECCINKTSCSKDVFRGSCK